MIVKFVNILNKTKKISQKRVIEFEKIKIQVLKIINELA